MTSESQDDDPRTHAARYLDRASVELQRSYGASTTAVVIAVVHGSTVSSAVYTDEAQFHAMCYALDRHGEGLGYGPSPLERAEAAEREAMTRDTARLAFLLGFVLASLVAIVAAFL